MLDSFKNIAKYLSHPLVLVGFVVLLFFKTLHILIESGILPTIAQDDGFIILLDLLRYGFIIGLVTIIAGFGLQFFKIHRTTQPIVDIDSIVERYANSQRALGRKESELADVREQFREAVSELAKLQTDKTPPSGIDKALELIAKGETGAAEVIFQEITTRHEVSVKEASAAYRHLGAITYLSDTDKSLNAYRRATELDPNSAGAWNRLGHLFMRIGKLNEAEAAYLRVEAIGTESKDLEWSAIAQGNLGILYKTRGDLDQAEAMYRKSLEIEEALGRKEGMANQYGNLGNLYQIRGDLDQAEAMYRKSLSLFKSLGAKDKIELVSGWIKALTKEI
ncbi:MAG: tetratricopeptide repeat protein [Sedimenticola sp.]